MSEAALMIEDDFDSHFGQLSRHYLEASLNMVSLEDVHLILNPFFLIIVEKRLPRDLRRGAFCEDVVSEFYVRIGEKWSSLVFNSPRHRFCWLLQDLKLHLQETIRFNHAGIRDRRLEHSYEQMIETGNFNENGYHSIDPTRDRFDPGIREDVLGRLIIAVENLDGPKREIVKLRLFHFMSFERIERELQIKANAACASYNRTIRRLRERFNPAKEDHEPSSSGK